MPTLTYPTAHEDDRLFPRVVQEADRLTITWPVRHRTSRAFATAFAFAGVMGSLAMLGWLPHPLDAMALRPAAADGKLILWISRGFRLMFAVGLPINLHQAMAGLWTMCRWDARGQVVTVDEGRITKEWVGPWGARRQCRPTADVVGVGWRRWGHLRRGGRVEQVTIRFRTGRPMRFGLWGGTPHWKEAVRTALATALATAPANSDRCH